MTGIIGVLAAIFAAALLVLPAVRVAQRRLPLREAAGLWIAGIGFGILAIAALLLEPEARPAAVLLGVIVAVVGNLVQRRATKAAR